MPTLLKIDSSPRTASVSTALSSTFVSEYVKKNPGTKVIEHNTTLENLPYVDEAAIGAYYTPAEALTPEQKQKLALSNQLVDELIAADVIVLAVPMWNFGIPASLKSWIDLVVRAGRTFAYGAQGPVGLLPAGKKVYLIVARGGAYSGASPAKAYDLQEPYLRTVLGFIGLTDIKVIYAENQASPAAAANGLSIAKAELAQAIA